MQKALRCCNWPLQTCCNVDTPGRIQEGRRKLDTSHVMMASEQEERKRKQGLVADRDHYVERATSPRGRNLRLALGLVQLNV